MKSPCSLLFSRLNTPSSSVCLCRRGAAASEHPHGPPLGPVTQPHIPPVLRAPDLDVALQMGPHEGRAEGNNPLPLPAHHPIFDAILDTVDLLGCKHILLAHVQSHFHPPSFHPPEPPRCSLKGYSQEVLLPVCTHLGLP